MLNFLMKLKTKYMNSLIEGEELLEAHNKIWEEISSLIKNDFDSELLYDKNYLKTKVKTYDIKINTYFHGNKRDI